MYNEIMKLSNYLKQYRKENKLTQQELADKLFVSKQAVSKWETERGLPDIETYKSISVILGVSVDELLGLEKNRSNNKLKILIIPIILVLLLVLTITLVLVFKEKENNNSQKEYLITKTENELGIKLPSVGEYNYIDYFPWRIQGNLELPLTMYYFVFDNDSLQTDYSWLAFLDDELIMSMPHYIRNIQEENDYFKIIDLTTGALNYINLNDDKVHNYVLYCYNVEKNRLIAITFEV